MFDLPESTVPSMAADSVSRLMQTLDVFINVRPKPNQSMLSVIVKGIERNASNIYEARRRLLGIDEPKITAEIPETYQVPNTEIFFQGNNGGNGGEWLLFFGKNIATWWSTFFQYTFRYVTLIFCLFFFFFLLRLNESR